METESAILLRLNKEIQQYTNNIKTAERLKTPQCIIAALVNLKQNKIRYRNELMNR